jgi:hypothetical protein
MGRTIRVSRGDHGRVYAPALVRALRGLCRQRIDEALADFADNVVMTSYAPAEVFPVLGRRQGKAAVAKTMLAMHADFEHLTCQPIFMATEAENAAVIVNARLR